MDKLYVLLAENPNTKEYSILTKWEKLPTQNAIDEILEKHKSEYSRFIIMQDILFIEGNATDTSAYYY